MEETLTITRLGVGGKLKRTLESTYPCESMIEIVRTTQRNVKRWSSGEMALRWTAAGMLEAEKQFRKIIGYRDLATLLIAIERERDRHRAHADAARTPTKEVTVTLTRDNPSPDRHRKSTARGTTSGAGGTSERRQSGARSGRPRRRAAAAEGDRGRAPTDRRRPAQAAAGAAASRPDRRVRGRSNRSRFITLSQAATKSRTNVSLASSAA